ncbi:MAG: hypothetical protein RL514_2294 [Verrucomicrobiota bacterium]|jgi:8-oxo-dGTP pyrophosphatase MutT (NUDIX family)
MWLFTTIGFFSVVRKDGEKHLTVRARSSADLDRLRQQFMTELSATISKAGTDYPFRATISQQAFAKGMASIGESIDYHNFKDEVAVKMGKKRAGTYSKVWSVLREIETEKAADAPAEKPAVKGVAYGGVVFRADGRLLLREPKNHYDAYVWTFPKGKAEQGESEQQAALREVREEGGVEAKIVRRIPGEFQGGTSKCVYFLMSVEREVGFDEDETQSVAWVTAEEAAKRIQQTSKLIGRKRDLAVLKAALALIG